MKMEDSRQSIDDSRNLLDSDSDDVEENVFDYQSQNDKQIGKQLALLFTWGTMVRIMIKWNHVERRDKPRFHFNRATSFDEVGQSS